MARRSFSDIHHDLRLALVAGTIRNVVYKDLSTEASRAWDRERQAQHQAEPRWDEMTDDARELYWKNDLPHSVLHLNGFIKRTEALIKRLAIYGKTYPYLQSRVDTAKDWIAMENVLKSLRPLIVKGRAPAEPKAPPANSGQCQCCGRIIGDSVGVIAHHGYKRPGNGYQTQSCYGATYPSFAISRDRLGEYINQVLLFTLGRLEAEFAFLQVDGVKVPGPTFPITDAETGKPKYENGRALMGREMVGPDHIGYARYLKIAQGLAERDLLGMRREVEAQKKRYDGWAPGAVSAPALVHYVNAASL